MGGTPTCEKPGCKQESEKTYRGDNNNKLRLCGKCYYRLVTRGESDTDPLGFGTDTGPFIRQIDSGSSGGTGLDVKIDPKKELEYVRKHR